MSVNTIPVDLDKHRLLQLLELYHRKALTREQALELAPLIERIWERALGGDVDDLGSIKRLYRWKGLTLRAS